MAISYPAAVKTLVSCILPKGRPPLLTQQGKDQISKQQSRGSTWWAKNLVSQALTPFSNKPVSPEAQQTVPHSEPALLVGCVAEESPLPPSFLSLN